MLKTNSAVLATNTNAASFVDMNGFEKFVGLYNNIFNSYIFYNNYIIYSIIIYLILNIVTFLCNIYTNVK